MVLVVVTDQVRWLRLAVLLAVWAAFLSALALSHSRREARAAARRMEESRLTYQRELQREVSARREYEVGLGEAVRDAADERHREVAALRQQLDRLNASLSTLIDGDLLVERLTLSAQSIRIRPLPTPADDGLGRPVGHPVAGALVLDAPPDAAFGNASPIPEQASSVPARAVPVPEYAVSVPDHGASASGPTHSGGDGAAPEPDPAHSVGIPVADLVAAYGGNGNPSRRRRRATE